MRPESSGQDDRYSRWDPTWTVPVVVVAVLLGLVLLGFSAYSLAAHPAKASHPHAPRHLQRAHGRQTPHGSESTKGTAGPAHTTVPRASHMVSAPDPQVRTVITAKIVDPAGSVLVSGAALVTASATGAHRNVALSESLPLSDTTWQARAIVTGWLGLADRMTLTPFVLCRVPASTSTSTTETFLSS